MDSVVPAQGAISDVIVANHEQRLTVLHRLTILGKDRSDDTAVVGGVQDPAVAHPLTYARKGFDGIGAAVAAAGL